MASAKPTLSPNTPLSYTPFSIFSRFSDSADPLADTRRNNPTTPRTLTQAVVSQRKRYRRPTRITIQVATWNIGNNPGTEAELSRWLDLQGDVLEQIPSPTGDRKKAGRRSSETTEVESVKDISDKDTAQGSTEAEGSQDEAHPSGQDKRRSERRVDLYVLGLQEVVDISSPTAVMRNDPTAIGRWRDAASKALPSDVRLILDVQLMGLLLLVYAVPGLSEHITSASATSVGTGLMGYLGNKGAVAIRLVIGETTRLAFINVHLAAGSEKTNMERRNWDAGQVMSRTKFSPVVDAGVEEEFEDQVGDEDYAWWFGDLNYRLDGMPGEDIRRLLALHMPDEESLQKAAHSPHSPFRPNADRAVSWSRSLADSDSSSVSDAATFSSTASTIVSSDDRTTRTNHAYNSGDIDSLALHPGTLESTLESLLPHDQLLAQQKAKKVLFDGWQEGRIGFLPTYKYDIGTIGVFDSSEKKRAPSWCDRILFRSKDDRKEYERRTKEEEETRRFEESIKSQNPDDVLYDYHPETDGGKPGDHAYDDESVPSAAGPFRSPHGPDDPNLLLHSYTSHQHIVTSDHKPVTAIFTLQYDEVVPDLKVQVFNEAARDFDRSENEDKPGVTIVVDALGSEVDGPLSSTVETKPIDTVGIAQNVNFGEIRFNQYVRRDLTIANTGKVPSTISFAQRQEKLSSGTPRICKPWLRVNCIVPSNVAVQEDASTSKPRDTDEIILDPGEALNVVLEIVVDAVPLLKALNDVEEELHDVLVLHVAGGRDHFLTISGTWMPSCFGRTVDELVRAPEGGVRALPSKQPEPIPTSPMFSPKSLKTKAQSSSPVLADHPVRWAAPKELYKLTEEIEDLTERAVADWEMKSKVFKEQSPWHKELAWPFHSSTDEHHERDHDLALSIREALDTGSSLKTAFPTDASVVSRLEALADTLLDFLGSLRDGIVTEQLWWDMEVENSKRTKAKLEVGSRAERDFVLDNLAKSPNHNICFVFITSMLEKVAGELADSGERPEVIAAPATGGSQRSKTLASVSEKPRSVRRSIDRRFAEIFADVIFRWGAGKERKGAAERRIKIIEVFLRKWEDLI